MRVFVTGATGFIGFPLVRELIGAGHTVVGLTRSDTGVAALKEAGAEVHRGALDDLDSLRLGAAAADGVIHLAFAFTPDSSDFAAMLTTDLRAVEPMAAAPAGPPAPVARTPPDDVAAADVSS